MIYSSQDLLYIVLAFCILWLTIFLSWSLYYVAMLLRGVYQVFQEFREKLALVDAFIGAVSKTLEHTSTSLQTLVDGAGRVVTYFSAENGKRPAAKPRRKKAA